jgi:hypothetical protein
MINEILKEINSFYYVFYNIKEKKNVSIIQAFLRGKMERNKI